MAERKGKLTIKYKIDIVAPYYETRNCSKQDRINCS